MNSRLLLTLIVVAAGFFCVSLAKPAQSQDQPEPKNAQLEKLLIERRDTARELVAAVEAEYAVGAETVGALVRAQNVLLDAELDLAKTKPERIRIHEQRVKNLRRVEAEIAAKAKLGVAGASTADLKSAQVSRLTAEIELERERAGR